MALTFYERLNLLIDYLEEHLSDEIDYTKLAQHTGLSLGTLRRFFPLFAGMTLSEYLRKRRLSLAAKDLVQEHARVIDVAVKYGYTSQTAFSRAFSKYHHLKPTAIKFHSSELSFCPKLCFTAPQPAQDVAYTVISQNAQKLYGLCVHTNECQISHDAPQIYLDIASKYPELPDPDYGLVSYQAGRDSSEQYDYWVLWPTPYHDFATFEVPASRWLKFYVNSQNAIDIQQAMKEFYESFLPASTYKLSSGPDLEYYHDGITEVMIPIE